MNQAQENVYTAVPVPPPPFSKKAMQWGKKAGANEFAFFFAVEANVRGRGSRIRPKKIKKMPSGRYRYQNLLFQISRDACSNSIANCSVFVFMGYRTSIARYVARWGIAQMCLCETKDQAGGASHHFGGVLTSLKKHRAIWGIAAIVSQYRAIWGH